MNMLNRSVSLMCYEFWVIRTNSSPSFVVCQVALKFLNLEIIRGREKPLDHLKNSHPRIFQGYFQVRLDLIRLRQVSKERMTT